MCVQSLNMYVPPDEAIHSYGEVGLRLQGDGLVDVQHTAHDPGVAAAVNPVYQRSVMDSRAWRVSSSWEWMQLGCFVHQIFFYVTFWKAFGWKGLFFNLSSFFLPLLIFFVLWSICLVYFLHCLSFCYSLSLCTHRHTCTRIHTHTFFVLQNTL